MDRSRLLQHFETLADQPEAVAKLRGLIFQLAVAGRLVTHEEGDPNWQKGIPDEKKRSIALLRLTKHPETSPLAPNELPYVMPEQWLGTRLGDLTYSCPTAYGENPSPELHVAGVITVGNIDNAGGFKGRFSERGFDPAEVDALLAHKGDIVVVKSSGSAENVHSGKAALCREEHHRKIVGSNFVMRLRAFGKSVLPEFLWLVLSSRTSRAWVERTVQTMTYPNLRWSEYAQLPIGLPPLPEQCRIVAKVEELLALCDELEARQTAARERRARLVHSALDHLTAAKDSTEFRKHADFILYHPVAPKSDGGGSPFILDDVPALRQSILSLAVQGRLVQHKRGDAQIREIKFEDIIEDSRYGSAKKCHYQTEGTAVLRIPNVVSGKIDLSDLKKTKLTATEKVDLSLKKGDLLVVRSNGSLSLVGRTAVVTEECAGSAFAGYLVRVRLQLSEAHPEFVQLALSSTLVRQQIETPIRTTSGVKNINTQEIYRLTFPFPPLAEQKRIVAKVDELMRWCGALEARLTAAQTAGTHLLDATLHGLLAA